MTDTLSAAKVMREAAQVIRERGHAKGDLRARDGAVCLFGALNAVTTGDAREWPHAAFEAWGSYKTCREYLVKVAVPGTTMGPNYWHELLVDWNNATPRTGAEVIAALESAATTIEKEFKDGFASVD